MKLQANKRTTENSAADVRDQNLIPAVCYGPDLESFPLSVNYKEFVSLYREIGMTKIIELDSDGELHEVMVKDVSYDPILDTITHIDFYAFKRGVEIELSIPLEFIGIAPALKLGGIVNEVMHELDIKCRPKDIPDQIIVDLTTLTDLDSTITVGDLSLGEGITVMVDEGDAVAVIFMPSEEEEQDAEAAQAAVNAVLAEKETTEDEEEEKS